MFRFAAQFMLFKEELTKGKNKKQQLSIPKLGLQILYIVST